MGKAMQESIKKIGEKLNCNDYIISMTIGKKAAEMFEIEKHGEVHSQRAINELSIAIQPKFEQDRRRSRREERKREMRGSMENEKI